MASSLSQIRVPIAQLEPNLESTDDSSVHGVVTLVWPYSSSTQSLSLLLVEPDFRLRRHQGQVRIQFRGSSAKAVAKAGVSSGDELTLSLRGASWEKDVTTANTPGRGIEWELRYGERIVVEVQHPGKAPSKLDIDHPPFSPEPPRQASSPPSSPTYNSHIPTSSDKQHFAPLNVNGTTWSSPAFLKRSHFAASSYDPFAELDEEFADNDRRKRTKFGRGSGQWKFVGNSPSPESAHIESAGLERQSSTSQAVQVDAEENGQEQAMLATPPLDVSSSSPKDSSSALEIATSAPLGQEVLSNPAEKSDMSLHTDDRASSPSFANGSVLDHRGHSLVSDGQVDQGSPLEAVVDHEMTGHSSQAFLQPSSPSSASSKSHALVPDTDSSGHERQAKENDSDAFWSVSASDFGIDGTIMTRLHQAPHIAPMASEIGRRWIEMQAAVKKMERAKNTAHADNTETSVAPQKEVPGQLVDPLLLESNQVEVNPKHISSAPPAAAVNQHSETTGASRKEALTADTDSEGLRTEHSERERTDHISIEVPQPEQSEWIIRDQNAELNVERNLDKVLKSKELEAAAKNARAQSATEEEFNEGQNVLPATIQDSATFSEGPNRYSLAPENTIIDLENDDNEDRQQYALTPSGNAPTSLVTGVTASQGTALSHHAEETAEQDNGVTKDFVARTQKISNEIESGRDDNGLDRTEVALNATQKRLLVHQEEPPIDVVPNTDSLGRPTSSATAAADEINKGIVYPELPPIEDLQDPMTDLETLSPWPPFPSTVQDAFEDPSASELMILNDTQRVGSLSKSSPLPNLSPPDDQHILTPSLTQGNSTGVVIPEPNSLVSYDGEQAKGPTSQGVASDKNIEVPNVDEERLAPRGPQDFSNISQIESQGIATENEPKEASLGELSTEDSAPKVVDDGKATSRKSSLITRLKELRRLSNQTPGKRLSESSASPWFAPRRSSQAISNGEAEGDAQVKPLEQTKTHAIKTPTKSTPEKTEKRLSESFIRSSPRQSPHPKSPSSLELESQYVPQSQPTTGFRTSLSYFVPLTSLHCHYGTSVTRATSGPKDFTQTIYLTDPSSTASKHPNSLTTAQIFRPRKTCFPEINVGDAVLLRDLKVQSFQKSLSLVSTDSSAWAVFRKDTDVQIFGPPVEYGPEEKAFARAHWNWWASLETAHKDALVAGVPKTKSAGASTTSGKKGLGFELLSSQAKKDTLTDEAKSVDGKIPESSRERSLGLDGSAEPEETKAEKAMPQRRVLRPRNARGKTSASPEKDTVPKVEEIHELRDGTRYVDREGVGPMEVDAQNGVHDLRDGTKYRDRIRK